MPSVVTSTNVKVTKKREKPKIKPRNKQIMLKRSTRKNTSTTALIKINKSSDTQNVVIIIDKRQNTLTRHIVTKKITKLLR